MKTRATSWFIRIAIAVVVVGGLVWYLRRGHATPANNTHAQSGGAGSRAVPVQVAVAAHKDYPIFDLTRQTPLLTAKKRDQSGKTWDKEDTTGLRFEKSVQNVAAMPTVAATATTPSPYRTWAGRKASMMPQSLPRRSCFGSSGVSSSASHV